MVPVSGVPAQETPDKERLEEVESQIEKSKEKRQELVEQTDAAEAEIKKITAQMIASAGRLQGIEKLATTKEAEIERLDSELSSKRILLTGKDQKVAEVLAALQRLSSRPVALVLAKPAESMALARSSALLARITPELEGEAKILRDQVVEIMSLRRQIQTDRRELDSSLTAIAAERVELDGLLDQRRQRRLALKSSTKSLDQEIAALAREAHDLRDLLRRLEADSERRRKAAADAARRLGKSLKERPAFPSARPFSSARGSLALPASGRLVERFGEQTMTDARRLAAR